METSEKGAGVAVSNLRILADWANMYADWEEGIQVSPSIDDLVRVALDRWQIPVEMREAFQVTWADKLELISQEGALLEEQLDALAEMVDEDRPLLVELPPPEPESALSFDEVEVAGLDGTLRDM